MHAQTDGHPSHDRWRPVARDGHSATAFVKGAPKETLVLCDTIRREGQTVPLSDEVRRAILADHDQLAAQGLRILAVARRPVGDGLAGGGASAVECHLTFLGLIALWGPPRPEVEDAVTLCRRAGIGDYGLALIFFKIPLTLTVMQILSPPCPRARR